MLTTHTHAADPSVAALVSLTLMWLGMMTVMMAPVAWPWVRAFDRFDTRNRGAVARGAAMGLFSAGYLAAWLLYSVAAALAQWGLQRAGAIDLSGAMRPLAGAIVLIGAGLYQFAPLKRACLTHCRNPISHFLTRWHGGPSGGFRMGFGHGVFCAGCCWALMATALVVGVMNLWWMAALAAAAWAEQAVPRGDLARVPLGLGLVIAGAVRLT